MTKKAKRFLSCTRIRIPAMRDENKVECHDINSGRRCSAVACGGAGGPGGGGVRFSVVLAKKVR